MSGIVRSGTIKVEFGTANVAYMRRALSGPPAAHGRPSPDAFACSNKFHLIPFAPFHVS